MKLTNLITLLISTLSISFASAELRTHYEDYNEIIKEEYATGNSGKLKIWKKVSKRGYGLNTLNGEHASILSVTFEGEEMNLKPILSYQEVEINEGYEPNWHFEGFEQTKLGWRYIKKGAKKEPFALIYRVNGVLTLMNDDFKSIDKVSSSTLQIVKLDGVNTKIIGAIDSIKADKEGKEANELAKKCADTILNKDISEEEVKSLCFNF